MATRSIQIDVGVLRIEQRIQIAGREIGTDVSGPVCIFARVRATRGTVAYLRGQMQVMAPATFDLVLPPYAIVQAVLRDADATSMALAFRPPRGVRLPREPVLLPAAGDGPLEGIDALCERLRNAEPGIRIGRASHTKSLARQGKRIIDAEYATALKMGRIAERLRTEPATFSRAFHAAYGIPPVRYRHQLRIVDALVRFAEGAVPAEVFQDVGFDDLSRFYKIFRKVACAAPGAYRPATSRNAKT